MNCRSKETNSHKTIWLQVLETWMSLTLERMTFCGLSDDQRTSVIEDLNTYDNLQSTQACHQS